MSADIVVGLLVIAVTLTAAIWVLARWSQQHAGQPGYAGSLSEYLADHGLSVASLPDGRFAVVDKEGTQVGPSASTAVAAALAALWGEDW